MTEEKSTYYAVFEYYINDKKKILNRKLHFKNVRVDDGSSGIIMEKWILDPSILPTQLVGHLTSGEVLSFRANIEFKDIEICYPHGELEKIK